jgi:uncharacterized glyoxalase superfamily protein PhnB
MRINRSVPADVVLPHVVYHDVPAAIAWLGNAFGFVEHYRYGDPVAGAQIYLGMAWIMLERARTGTATPVETQHLSQYLTLFIDNLDAHYERAKAAGVTILEAPHQTVYGEYQYVALDLAGHRWIFSTHTKDVHPNAWGAVRSTG